MPILEKITSLQNSRVKDIVKLHRSRARRESGLIIVEGLREISLAIEARLETKFLMVCPAYFQEGSLQTIQNLITEYTCFEVSSQVFEKMAYREQSDGLLAVMHAPEFKLNDIKLTDNPLVVVLESIEKPGNLGAILRTADAAGADAVIICDPLTDIYNPNVIRSSIGCVFTKQVVACASQDALEWLQKHNIEPIAAALTANEYHYSSDFTKPLAFIFGTEAEGLSNFWLNSDIRQVKIPMLGKIDSLNVSNSAAIIIYEALRQRRV
jgi:RNA methyltransferase, TrmH family